MPGAKLLPLRHVLLVDGHVNGILARVSDSVELFQQEFDELRLALHRNNGEAVDDDERVQSLLQAHFILRFQIW